MVPTPKGQPERERETPFPLRLEVIYNVLYGTGVNMTVGWCFLSCFQRGKMGPCCDAGAELQVSTGKDKKEGE